MEKVKLPMEPKISYDTEPFWKLCSEHKFQLQKCDNCATIRWPAAFVCPKCLCDEYKWTQMSGKGKIWSFVIFHRPFHPNFKGMTPYVVASVQLDEGPRFTANIVGGDPSKLECDQRVKLAWKDGEQGVSLPVFELE